jgi:hypothetical protein
MKFAQEVVKDVNVEDIKRIRKNMAGFLMFD